MRFLVKRERVCFCQLSVFVFRDKRSSVTNLQYDQGRTEDSASVPSGARTGIVKEGVNAGVEGQGRGGKPNRLGSWLLLLHSTLKRQLPASRSSHFKK